MEIEWTTLMFHCMFLAIGIAIGVYARFPVTYRNYRSYALEITADEQGVICCVKVGGVEFVPGTQDLARQELRALTNVAAGYSMCYPELIAAVKRAGDFLGMERSDAEAEAGDRLCEGNVRKGGINRKPPGERPPAKIVGGYTAREHSPTDPLDLEPPCGDTAVHK